jgi:hypothetical protein
MTPSAPPEAGIALPPCRFCGAPLRDTFVDLGPQPLCESFVAPEDAERMEPFYPLHVRVCRECLLVQLPAYVDREEIFREYAYFSSYSDSWVEHARRYADAMVARLDLGPSSSVVELASNDGYLLQHFVTRGIPVLGIEPARNVASAAEARGVPTLTEFFGRDLAERLLRERGPADLVIGNNVLARCPTSTTSWAASAILLGPNSVATLEFPRRPPRRGVSSTRSTTTASRTSPSHDDGPDRRGAGPRRRRRRGAADHGGSCASSCAGRAEVAGSGRRGAARGASEAGGYADLSGYAGFEERVREAKRALLAFLIEARRAGLAVAGYGAPGKGNTLLNYCGIRTDLLDYTVDRNPYKHGRLTPGTRIPIFDPGRLAETRPDVILILPWNLRDEIARQLAYTREWGARLIVPIPTTIEVT